MQLQFFLSGDPRQQQVLYHAQGCASCMEVIRSFGNEAMTYLRILHEGWGHQSFVTCAVDPTEHTIDERFLLDRDRMRSINFGDLYGGTVAHKSATIRWAIFVIRSRLPEHRMAAAAIDESGNPVEGVVFHLKHDGREVKLVTDETGQVQIDPDSHERSLAISVPEEKPVATGTA